ncbi:hypothetical protein FisN_4Lh436 [Fistulifera solaris]|uniref:Uncharacterized protein n=1 Tax=Fistulifera solaris TaxID=1519565 RepID=A0A1Z5KDD7_FISSO|nr:hypothetical protein FisN_4Lh436 [Fistulifera solaris]|eukprot:GAX24320.1 hypothetical protein FisN_4Lh436 [Fistulifera solaris]
MATSVSGLAASIRGATESETFDLAGQGVSTIEKQIHDGFKEPLPLSEMIRLTFITGAGKLGRQKYDEGAAQAVTRTLRELGYEEDRGASAVLECGGTFKLQHDTGKNLKTVVVFPRVAVGIGETEMEQLSLNGGPKQPLLAEDSPEYKLAHSTLDVFKRNIPIKCPSWTQTKGCVAALISIKERLQGLESKLMSGTVLTDAEQAFYDSVSLSSVEDKLAFVRERMHELVEGGNVTAEERRNLLEQVNDKIKALDTEIEQLKKEGKMKRVETLQAKRATLQARKTKVEGITPKPIHPLKHETDIHNLRRELLPIEEIEEKAKGRLMTLKENQVVARKDDILQQISDLEQQSRGWFESDEIFQARVQQSLSSWNNQKKNAKKATKPASKSKPTSMSLPTTAKWVTPASRGKPAPKQQTNKPSTSGGLFAAMMNDSDSD